MAKYDLLLKGGHVIDPFNNLDRVNFDVAITSRTIASVAKNIPETDANKVIDVSGWYVTPGLIDMHAHATGFSGSMFPDEMCLPYGVTTMVDCGGAGWRDFDVFNDNVIKQANVTVLALLNIVGSGMKGDVEQDVEEMDVERTANLIKRRGDILVGVKVAHFQGPSWESVDRGVEAARRSNTFCLIDQNAKPSRPFSEMLLEHMRPGDGVTHCYGHGKPMIGNDGKVKQHYIKARANGIKFDVGHGNNSFSFSMAIPALEQGFPPDTISTDMHRLSMRTSRADMTEVMSKFLAMGMPIQDIIRLTTISPAHWIQRPDLGTLTPGVPADVAVLEFLDRPCGLSDSGTTGFRTLPAEGRLVCQLTIRGGNIQWDRDGRSKQDWTNTPKTNLDYP